MTVINELNTRQVLSVHLDFGRDYLMSKQIQADCGSRTDEFCSTAEFKIIKELNQLVRLFGFSSEYLVP